MTATVDEMKTLFGSFEGDRANLAAQSEIYPGYSAPVLRKEEGALTLQLMIWGFPGPQAAKGRRVTNVRNLSSPFWRSALTNPARRCLVPVTRFSEWSQKPDPDTGRKVKHWFGRSDEGLFAFAGIWRPGEEAPYFSFLTCEPNALVGAVHPKAMPVILQPQDHDKWLDGEVEEACELAAPFADSEMTQFA